MNFHDWEKVDGKGIASSLCVNGVVEEYTFFAWRCKKCGLEVDSVEYPGESDFTVDVNSDGDFSSKRGEKFYECDVELITSVLEA